MPTIPFIGISILGSKDGETSPLDIVNFNVVLVNEDGVDEQYAYITWTASPYETEIYRELDGAEATLLTTVAQNIGEYKDQLMDGDEHEVEYYARHKEDLTVLNVPSGLAVALISGGFRLTWDDNNTEADVVEIWSDHLSDTFSLIATVNAGVETYDHIFASLNINYKIRAKEGTLPVYSEFTDVVNKTDTRFLSKPVGNEYAYVADNGALDITGSFTLCGWFKAGTTAKDAYHYLAGKLIGAGVAGRYGLQVNTPGGNFVCSIHTSTGQVAIASAIDWTNEAWYFVRMDVNATTSKLRLFINETQVGTDTTFTGTLENIGMNQFEFYIGCGNNADGSGVASIAKCMAIDVQVFNKVLSSEEAARVYAKKTITGIKAKYPCNAYPVNDVSINGYNLTGVNLSSSNIVTP